MKSAFGARLILPHQRPSVAHNMKNKVLHKLNFETLLSYPTEFQPRHHYGAPICCDRFCIQCEADGTLKEAGGKLTLMSHGCEISDFEQLLGPMPEQEKFLNAPVMFLLEDPGGDYDLGEDRTFNGFTKTPPVNHYYFSTASKTWPRSLDDVIRDGNYYGTYFAYLIQKHPAFNRLHHKSR
jgi:hypothetical protein